MLEISDIFFFGGGGTVDAWSEPTYAEKIRVPPWDYEPTVANISSGIFIVEMFYPYPYCKKSSK